MSHKKTAFQKKVRQQSEVDKILPLRTVRGSGTYLSAVQENRNGRVMGAGNVCSRAAAPETEARMRRWAKEK